MELDGFCEEIALAFEYHGEQHYKYLPFYHREEGDFEMRQKFDAEKVGLCNLHNVKLIVVPYTVGIDNIANFLYEACHKFGFDVQLDDFYWKPNEVYHSRGKRIELMRTMAIEHGGKCLSEHYLNSTTKLRWQCKKGHEWEMRPADMIRHHWCPYCAGMYKTIGDMRALAASRGGECLSNEFLGVATKLRWKCANGHEWLATPSGISVGRWCPKCGKKRSSDMQRGSIEKMQNIARQRGGVCLSTEYKTARLKLRWRCSEGHEWDQIPDAVKRGSWCPKCAHKRTWITRRLNQK